MVMNLEILSTSVGVFCNRDYLTSGNVSHFSVRRDKSLGFTHLMDLHFCEGDFNRSRTLGTLSLPS